MKNYIFFFCALFVSLLALTFSSFLEDEALTAEISSVTTDDAELTTSRLVVGNSPRLMVTGNETRKVVCSIPLKDYELLHKSAETEYSKYTYQEFLDCQDECDKTFFLDEGDCWMDSHIYNNFWKILLQSA